MFWRKTLWSIFIVAALFTFTQISSAETTENETWSPTTLEDAPVGRYGHTAVWTGEEMIIWGGYYPIDHFLNDGGRYNPTTDTWVSVPTDNAPIGRLRHSAVWTGNEMIVWGGESGGGSTTTNTGGIYYPATNTWKTISTENAPAAREMHSAIWTGERMIVWGGCKSIDCLDVFNDGGSYNPDTDIWTPILASPGLAPRHFHQAFWTGEKMLIWGGTSEIQGAIYEPSTGTWSLMSIANAPIPAFQGAGVWTGTEMVVWGGCTVWSTSPCPTYTSSGGIYNLATNTWHTTAIADAPESRWTHTAIWTGKEMVVWGGCGDGCYNSGSKYNPSTNTWNLLDANNAPMPRANHKAVWTGLYMIVWGGCDVGGCGNVNYFDTGGRLFMPSYQIFIPVVTN